MGPNMTITFSPLLFQIPVTGGGGTVFNNPYHFLSLPLPGTADGNATQPHFMDEQTLPFWFGVPYDMQLLISVLRLCAAGWGKPLFYSCSAEQISLFHEDFFFSLFSRLPENKETS